MLLSIRTKLKIAVIAVTDSKKGKFFMVDDNIVSGPSSSVLPIGREIERNSEEILKIIYIITKSFL